jgi:hypothetical protein
MNWATWVLLGLLVILYGFRMRTVVRSMELARAVYPASTVAIAGVMTAISYTALLLLFGWIVLVSAGVL